MRLAVELVFRGGQTIRGSASALALMGRHLLPTLPMPCANAIHSWILRLGHYQLHRSLPPSGDWVWFIDQTLTIGLRKVLAIVGCRINDIPFAWRSLAATDLELIHVATLEQCSHKTLLPELAAAKQRVGTPCAIVTDAGTDLVKTIGLFCQQHSSVRHVLDMAHIGANALKKRWTADPRWSEFLQQLTQTNQRIRQKELAYLLSPRLRDKGRFMSVGVLLRFARRVLYALDRQLLNGSGVEAYGWLDEYRTDVERWSLEQQLVGETIKEVRENGWHEASVRQLEQLWNKASAESSSGSLVESLREFALKMSLQVKADETLPGSTEVLESVFGHWKRVIEAGPSVGVSGLVLALGGVMKPIPPEEYVSAWNATPLKRVWKWVANNIGETMQKMRKAFYTKTVAALA
jgi:hypothetical protein